MTFARRVIAWTFIVSLCLAASAVTVIGQDAAEIGKEQLGRRAFNWYEDSNHEVKDNWRYESGNAFSKNRRTVSKGNKTNQKNTNMNWNNNWWNMFSATTWILLGVVLAVVVGLIIWLCLQMESRTGSSAGSTEFFDDEDLEQRIRQLPFDLTKSTKGNLQELALQAAGRGDYNRAVMLLFSHVLISLDRKNLIQLRKGKTNRQYIREIRRHPELINYYEKVMVPFEDSFFGDHEVDKNRFESCWKALGEFHRSMETSIATIGI